MPTDQQNSSSTPTPSSQQSAPPTQTAQPVTQLVTEMQKIDTTAPEAQSNATSISDGQGGRIEFNEQPQRGTLTGTTSIKK